MLSKQILRVGKITLTFEVLVVGLILLTALFLRGWNYWQIPLTDETADEVAWTWLGASLIKTGIPTSWSYYSQYEAGYIYKTGIVNAPVVRPALDHPPLFALIPGAMQAAQESNWLSIPSRKVIRLPMVFLGVLNVLLLYLVAKKMFSGSWALVAATVYATAPAFVLASRLVVAENLLITWSLLLFLLVIRWSEKTKDTFKLSWWIVVLSVAAVLTKIPGIVLPLTILGYGVVSQHKGLLKVGIASTLFGLLALSST